MFSMQEIFIKYFSKIKRIFIYFDCRINPEMDDYVNDAEEGGEFGKAKDDCKKEEYDDPTTHTLSTKAKQSPANGKLQLGLRQQTGLGMLYRLSPKFMSKFLGHAKWSCKRFTLVSFPLWHSF